MRSLRTLAVVLMVPVLAACGASPAPSQAAPAPAPAAVVTPTADPCPQWGCEQQSRFTAASTFIAAKKGHLGIVVRDRVTGAVWRGGEPDFRIWAGSVPKLAFALSLKQDEAAGKLSLDADADRDIDGMLAVSDNNAADQLWGWFARPSAQMTRWRDIYGMSTASYVDGFPNAWGFVKCSAQDLANLMSYILDKADPQLRSFLVDRMRTVGRPQQWGVWGAGAGLHPGVKDGWSVEADDNGNGHWITATVGFVGPNERYVVGAMYDQPTGGDTIEAGVHTLTDLVATVFGAPVPAPAVIPEDY